MGIGNRRFGREGWGYMLIFIFPNYFFLFKGEVKSNYGLVPIFCLREMSRPLNQWLVFFSFTRRHNDLATNEFNGDQTSPTHKLVSLPNHYTNSHTPKSMASWPNYSYNANCLCFFFLFFFNRNVNIINWSCNYRIDANSQTNSISQQANNL